MPKKYRSLLIATIAAIVLYIANRLLFLLPEPAMYYTVYHYSLEALYGFFLLCALLVLFIANSVHSQSPDNTGYVFMGVTLLQMGVAYLMLRPLLGFDDPAISFERKNFFAVFILFLAIETLLTIRLLNNKQ